MSALVRWALSATLVLALLSPPSAAQPRDPAQTDHRLERWLLRAAELRDAGRTAGAVRLWRRALDRAPTDPRAPVALVAVLLPGDPEEAASADDGTKTLAMDLATHLRSAIDATSAHAASPRDTSPATRRRDPPRSGVPRAETEAAGVPDSDRDSRPSVPQPRAAAVEAALAWAIAIAGEPAHAVDLILRGLRPGTRDAAPLLVALASLAVHRGDLPLADRALEGARRARPLDPTILQDLAAVRMARGRASEAVVLLRGVARAHPEDLALARALAVALLAAGESVAALDTLRRIETSCPMGARARCAVDVSQAALESGEFARAEEAARRALTYAPPSDAHPAVLLGLSLTARQQTRDASEAFREALRRDPRNARARQALEALRETP